MVKSIVSITETIHESDLFGSNTGEGYDMRASAEKFAELLKGKYADEIRDYGLEVGEINIYVEFSDSWPEGCNVRIDGEIEDEDDLKDCLKAASEALFESGEWIVEKDDDDDEDALRKRQFTR